MSLYRELDNIEKEENLALFAGKLEDRFGPVPKATAELFNALRLRWKARKVGFEKILLKNNRFVGYFVHNQESLYYQSEAFSSVLNYVKDNPSRCRMKESNERLSITFPNVKTVGEAIKILDEVGVS